MPVTILKEVQNRDISEPTEKGLMSAFFFKKENNNNYISSFHTECAGLRATEIVKL